MQVNAIPNCCVGKIIVGLGRSATAANVGAGEITEERIRGVVQEQRNRGNAFLIAVTNSDQIQAASALRANGFRSTRPMRSNKHGTTTQHWLLILQEK